MSFIILANMNISLVNCAEYPDLCDLFNVTVFPTIKFRYERRVRWMDGQMFGWIMDGWTNVWMDNGWMDKCLYG